MPRFWLRLLGLQGWKLSFQNTADNRIFFKSEHDQEIPCLDIVAITPLKSLLSRGIEIRTKSDTYRLLGLNAEATAELSNFVLLFVNRYLAKLILSDKRQVELIAHEIQDKVDQSVIYLARADVANIISQFPGDIAKALSHPLLSSGAVYSVSSFRMPKGLQILTDTNERELYNRAFLSAELERFEGFFDDLGGVSLSNEQREACIRLEDSNLLVACAGSGKTATMVGKVAYVVEKQLLAPDQILVLAYNRSAADELKTRIAKQLQVDEDELNCKVTTFHAFGREIIEQTSGKPPQLANWVDHPIGEAKVIQNIIQDLCGSDADFQQKWIELLSLYSKADLPVTFFDSEDDYRQYISTRAEKGSGKVGTMSGFFVRSIEEQRIADWLWQNSVEFEYERSVEVGDGDGTTRTVIPDFYYPKTDTWHEHFAIDADGNSPFPNYVKNMHKKLAAYQSMGFDLIQTKSAHVKADSLFSHLDKELRARGQIPKARSAQEIAKAIEPVVIKHFEKIISVCVKHIRANRFSLPMLREQAKKLYDVPRAKRFVEIVWKVTEAYSRKLEQDKSIDFEAMISDAARMVESGRFESPYDLLLVDEFQDISGPRANLIKACKQQRPLAKVFAVGDDWQSIYRFSGSDISIFTKFEESFGVSWRGYLSQTYRCNQAIAQISADFVQKNPEQLKKEVNSVRPAVMNAIRVIPVRKAHAEPNFDAACDRVLRRLDSSLETIASRWRTDSVNKLTVLVLWRYNHLNPFKKGKPTFKNIEVNGLSFHRSKGLEADYTILMDVSEGDYGVPSRIEDDELLHLVIPEPERYPYAEERRLFYVALTRAIRGAFLIVNERFPSRYIKELREIAPADVKFETVDGESLEACPKCSVGTLKGRQGPKGSTFYGCTRYPACTFKQDCPPSFPT